MKLLITTLTMIFISFGAVSKTIKYVCAHDYVKTETPLFGERKLYLREDGKWVRICKSGEISNDSFKCPVKDKSDKFAIFDEVIKQLILYKHNGEKKITHCEIIK